MLELEFSGWFECRLATDPDPADEPRGVSGTTFACPGEPDLDRVIRFQPASTNRSPGPTVGVRIRRVTSRGEEAADHPWRGGRVELVGDARFEGRNGLLGIPGTEPIHPLELAVSGDGVGLRRRDWLDADDPGLLDASPQAVARRSGGGIERGGEVAATIGRATAIDDFLAYRRARAEAIESALTETGDPVRAAGLRRRRAALSSVARLLVSYRLELGGRGGAGRLDGLPPGPAIDLRAPWPLRFWMGGWDADALCGFVSGTLGLPEA